MSSPKESHKKGGDKAVEKVGFTFGYTHEDLPDALQLMSLLFGTLAIIAKVRFPPNAFAFHLLLVLLHLLLSDNVSFGVCGGLVLKVPLVCVVGPHEFHRLSGQHAHC